MKAPCNLTSSAAMASKANTIDLPCYANRIIASEDVRRVSTLIRQHRGQIIIGGVPELFDSHPLW